MQIELVRQHTKERVFGPGQTFLHEGDVGGGLSVLTRGSVTMLCAGDGLNAKRQRFVSFSPAIMFGEAALLEPVGRTADAVADIESTVHELAREPLDALRAIDPEHADPADRHQRQSDTIEKASDSDVKGGLPVGWFVAQGSRPRRPAGEGWPAQPRSSRR